MKLEWGYLFGMVLQTVVEPRKVAREVQAVDLPRNVLWETLGLLLVASTFLTVLSGILFPVDAAEVGPLLSNPMMMSIAQASISVLTVFGIYWVGRAAGGEGTFDAALLTVIWVQFAQLILELGVIFLAVFAPGMSLLLSAMAAVFSFWIFSHFIAEMHGFTSAALVFAGILVTGVLIVFGLTVLLGIIGIFIPVEIGTGAP